MVAAARVHCHGRRGWHGGRRWHRGRRRGGEYHRRRGWHRGGRRHGRWHWRGRGGKYHRRRGGGGGAGGSTTGGAGGRGGAGGSATGGASGTGGGGGAGGSPNTLYRASVDSNGLQANGDSTSPSLSADGRFVVFASRATNLAPNTATNRFGIDVYDAMDKTTRLVSVNAAGEQSDADARNPSISDDGRLVVFDSTASNLVANDDDGDADVFVRDLQAGTTRLVSAGSDGMAGDAASSQAVISGNGRFVAFSSSATNLVTPDTRQYGDVFVRDLTDGTNRRVSVNDTGAEGNRGSTLPSISGDGRFIAFVSSATNLASGDTNNVNDVFLRDMQLGTIQRVSVAGDGAQANGHSSSPRFRGRPPCRVLVGGDQPADRGIQQHR